MLILLWCSEKDKRIAESIKAHNKLEAYTYQLKSTVEDTEKLADKLSADDKETILKHTHETIDWLESHRDAEADDIAAKQKELEAVCDPIMKRVYEATGGVPPSSGDDASEAGGYGTPSSDDSDFPDHDTL